jgi:hypothetical protein
MHLENNVRHVLHISKGNIGISEFMPFSRLSIYKMNKLGPYK